MRRPLAVRLGARYRLLMGYRLTEAFDIHRPFLDFSRAVTTLLAFAAFVGAGLGQALSQSTHIAWLYWSGSAFLAACCAWQYFVITEIVRAAVTDFLTDLPFAEKVLPTPVLVLVVGVFLLSLVAVAGTVSALVFGIVMTAVTN